MNKQQAYTKTDKIITKITTGVASIIAVILCVWGIRTLYFLIGNEEANDAQIEEYINPITSRVSGYIKEIKFEENQEVKKGDTLLVIDNREYTLAKEEGEAGLQNARSQVEVLESNVSTAGKIAEVNNAQIAAAKARLVKQQKEYDRYVRLFDAESATGQQLENVKAAMDIAQSEYDAALNNYQASLSKINDSKAQIAPVLSEIKRRQLMLQRNQLDESYTIITAPYNGKMGRRTIQPGQQIQIGQTLAFIVDEESGKWVIANFKETQLKYLQTGKGVDITIDAYPDSKIKGKVVSLSPATGSRFSLLPPDNATGNFVKIAQRIPVKIMITDRQLLVGLLHAGMNASVSVSKKESAHD